MNEGLGQVESEIERLRDRYNELLDEKNEEYDKRDNYKKELMNVQNKLEKKYLDAEIEFVPMFQDLANLFLGVDVDIRMESSKTVTDPGLSLILELKGEARREVHELSQSQRFFLDIALRMSLAQYMSSDVGPAPLFIDTPEGSLDITYESRAGEMIARFAQEEHDIVMTANINSSQILLELADRCGHNKMELRRMTSWTELTDVQREGEELFDKAYADIEKRLNEK